jgi:hypothetical protein
MQPQKDTAVFEIDIFTYWVENDILMVCTAKQVERTMENAAEFIAVLERLNEKAGRKICILCDLTNTRSLTKEMREYYDRLMPRYVTAVALFSESTLGSAVAFIYATMHGHSFAIKIGDNEQECREWLKDYLSPNPPVQRPAAMDESDALTE